MKKFLIAGILVLCAASARADIKYTQVTTMGDGSTKPTAVMSSNRTLRAVRDGAERSETTMKIGKMEINSISIRFCNPEKTVRLDPSLKIYTEDLPAKSNAKPGAAGRGTSTRDAAGPAKTGKIVATYKVQDLGVGTVAKWKARHYKIGIKMEFSGCVGNRKMDMNYEYWVADVKNAMPCKFNPGEMPSMPNMAMPKSDCHLTFEVKGDVAAFGKANNGLIVRSKMYMAGKLVSTTEVTSLSQAKLSDDLFKIPAGYKKMTPEEFQKAQSAAMMKVMMGGAMSSSPSADDE